MGVFLDRAVVVQAYLSDSMRFGFSETTGRLDGDVLFLLDGVGGLQAGPLMVRRALRERDVGVGTVLFKWQFGLPGEIWTDLMWLRRNRLMGARLARKILGFRRSHPTARTHIVAFSGGCGVAVFALEHLRGRELMETVVLACPALSSDYNLGPALCAVRRCYALVSAKDRFILGWGTRAFGTMDRAHGTAAGCVGFRRPQDLDPEAKLAYERLTQVCWSPDMARLGHHGGHTGWASPLFLRRYLPDWLMLRTGSSKETTG